MFRAKKIEPRLLNPNFCVLYVNKENGKWDSCWLRAVLITAFEDIRFIVGGGGGNSVFVDEIAAGEKGSNYYKLKFGGG